MRKVLVLLLTIAVVSTIAFGTDFSWKGEIRTRTANYENVGLEDAQNVESIVDSRVRLYTTATMSENLKAVVGFEIGDFVWGDDDHNADYENVEVKNAYLEFTPDMIDMLTFRVGLQTYVDQFGSAVFDEDAAGIMIMPEFEGFNMNAGLFVLEDYEPTDNNPETFAVVDMSKDMDALSLKGSFYYYNQQYWKTDMYFGIGADYMMNDSITFGGQFVYNTQKMDEETMMVINPNLNSDSSGYFAYLYGEYKQDKLSAKLNFGYSPADYTGDDPVYFNGIEPFAYLYGLEYSFPGDVYDGNGLFNYGGEYKTGMFVNAYYEGSMVIAANLKYDFLFANFGLINAAMEDMEETSKGIEIDLGLDYELTEGLSFKAVYAMFMPGDYYSDDAENGSELSTQLKYKF